MVILALPGRVTDQQEGGGPGVVRYAGVQLGRGEAVRSAGQLHATVAPSCRSVAPPAQTLSRCPSHPLVAHLIYSICFSEKRTKWFVVRNAMWNKYSRGNLSFC